MKRRMRPIGGGAPTLQSQDVKDWNVTKVSVESTARVNRINEVTKRGFDNLSKAQIDELRDLHTELGVIDDRAEELRAGNPLRDGMPFPPGGSFSGNYALPGKARTSDAWGAAFIKGMERQGMVKDLTPSGSISVPGLIGTIVRDPDRPRSILELVPFVPLVATDQWAFRRETERTHAAAVVAPGGRKPRSTYALEKVEATTKTIAHLTQPIDRNDLSDTPAIQEYVNGALREGVELALEDQVLTGDGLAGNMLGIANTPGISAVPFDTDAIRTARLAITYPRADDSPCAALPPAHKLITDEP